MATTLADIRAKYPQYAEIPDQELADRLHQKFYSSMPAEEFYGKIGMTRAAPEDTGGFAGMKPIGAPDGRAGEERPATPAPAIPEQPTSIDPKARIAAALSPAPAPEAAPVVSRRTDTGTRLPDYPPSRAPRGMDRPGASLMDAGVEAARLNAQTPQAQIEAAMQPPPPPGGYQTFPDAVAAAVGNTPERLSRAMAGNRLLSAESGIVVDLADIGALKEGASQLAAVQTLIEDTKARITATPLRDPNRAGMERQLIDLSARERQLASLYGGAGEMIREERANVERQALASHQAADAIAANDAAMNPVSPRPGLPEYTTQAIASLADMAPGFVSSVVTRNPLPLMAYLTAYSRGGTYADKRGEGFGPEQARTAANLYALSEGIPEALPLHFILKPGGPIARKLFEGAASEGIQETFTEGLQILVDQGVLDENMTWAEARERMATSGIVGGISGGMMAGGVGAVDAVTNAAAARRAARGTPADPLAYPSAPPPPAPAPAPPQAAPAQPAPPQPEAAPVALAAEAAPTPEQPSPPPAAPPTEQPGAKPPQPPPSSGPASSPAADDSTAAGGNYEVLDETETVDGETRPTGRKVRVNLDTGQAEVIDAGSPDVTAGASGETSGQGNPGKPQAGSEAAPSPSPSPAAPPAEAPGVQVLRNADIAQIGTDAKTFQYKAGGDEQGVTDRLKGVTKWAPERAGVSLVYEYADGRRVVADGHQRLGLAKRLAGEGQDISLPAMVLRQVDGVSPEEARTIAALKTISEGTGTAIDAAKVLRQTGQAPSDLGLPPNSALVRDAGGLQKLDDEAFGMVVNGVVPEGYGAIVGQTVPNKGAQASILKLLAKLKPANAFQAEAIARQAAEETTTETQVDLFGSSQIEQNLYLERAKVLDAAVKGMSKQARVFSTLIDQKGAITGKGNVLNNDANAAAVDEAGKIRQYLTRTANSKGPISDALGQAARDFKATGKLGPAVERFLAAVRGELSPGSGDRPSGGEGRPDAKPSGGTGSAAGSQDQAAVAPKPAPAPAKPKTPQEQIAAALAPAPKPAPEPKMSPHERMRLAIIERLKPLMAAGGDKPMPAWRTDLFRFKDGKDHAIRDFLSDLGATQDVNARHRRADRFVREWGERTGNEALVVFDKAGIPVSITSGVSSHVVWTEAGRIAAERGEVGYATHNHPSSRAFSSGDIQAMLLGFGPIAAIGHNGDEHRADTGQLGVQLPHDNDKSLTARTFLDEMYDGMTASLQDLVWKQPVAEQVAFIDKHATPAASAAFVMALEKAGIITYKGPAMDTIDRLTDDYGVDTDVFLKVARDALDRHAPGLGRAGFNVAAIRDRLADQGTGSDGANAGGPAGTRPDAEVSRPSDSPEQSQGVSPEQGVTPDDFDAAAANALDAVFGKKPEAKPAGKPAAPRSDDDIGKDLGDLFNEPPDLFGEMTPEEAKAQAAAAKAARDKADLEARQQQSKMRNGGQTRIEDELDSLFGHGRQGGLFEPEAAFDTAKYDRAKPLFMEAARGVDVAGGALQDTLIAFVRRFADKGLTRDGVERMLPYLRRFLEDVRSGKIALEGETDVSGSDGGVEPDSGRGPAADGVRPEGVSPAGRPDGRGSGSPGAAGSAGNGRPDAGGAVPSDNAAPVGGGRDQDVQGAGRPGEQPADGGIGTAGGRPGEPGVSPDDSPAATTRNLAAKPADVGDRAAAQAEADRIAKAKGVLWANEVNVRATLPLLLPAQQDDVLKVERRFAKPDGHGMMLTNGTGTGKTYSGGGVIKRFAQAGKNNILILAPSQGILDHWIQAGADLGLTISRLDDTKSAGKGIVATTYANAGENNALAGRNWDLVVTDESHKLSSAQDGASTRALDTVRAITHRPGDLWRKSQMLHAAEWDAMQAMKKGDAKDAEFRRLKAIEKAEVAKWETQPRSKVLFLSATPFAYDKNTDYAESYLFNYPEDGHVGHSRQSGRNLFMVENFAWRIRMHKLTEPDPSVDRGVFQRQFHEKLKRDGVLSGRQLDIDADYERRFVTVEDELGSQIDGVLDYLRDKAWNGTQAEKDTYKPLLRHVEKRFNYLNRSLLLEAIKTKRAQATIDKHLALGRKVVVFHDFNKGGGFNPFNPDSAINIDAAMLAPESAAGQDALTAGEALPGYQMLLAARPEVARMNFEGYAPPVIALKAKYGDRAVIYNGTVPNKLRAKAKADFNKDGSGVDIIVVQSAAGEAGISLHDITGGHQRALVNLGMPTRPTTALQEEGRIRREGSVSNAIFHYFTIGTTWERTAFAARIADRSGGVENLALGDEARTIRDSFIEAYQDASPWEPSEADGKGGKEKDRRGALATPYEQAKAHYFGRMKISGNRLSRDGIDFYPTPEPLAFKMVEWAQARPGEKMLEPSAGDGSIARYMPETTDRTIVEPSGDLMSRAQLRAVGARAFQSRFENLHIANKYHTIVMNPPFGSGGKTAFEHLEKAMGHLKPGGRIVALVPAGPTADGRLDKLTGGDAFKGFRFTANLALPGVTFEKAGTSVRSRVVIIDRVSEEAPYAVRDWTGIDTIKEFFDRIEDRDVPARPAPVVDLAPDIVVDEDGNVVSSEPAPAPAPVAPPVAAGLTFELAQTKHGKTGEDLFVATADQRVDGDAFNAMREVAKARNGWWSSFKGNGAIPGFQFRTEADRAAFVEDMAKPTIGGLEQPAWHGSPHIHNRFSTDFIGTGEGAQVYGWGLYFAGKKAIAEWYRDKLGSAKIFFQGQPFPEWAKGVGISSEGYDQVRAAIANDPPQRPEGMSDRDWRTVQTLMPYSVRSTLNTLRDKILTSPGDDAIKRLGIYESTARAQMQGAQERDQNYDDHLVRAEAAKWLAGQISVEKKARLYAVEVPDDAHLLVWEKPLSEQPEAVQKALRKALGKIETAYEDGSFDAFIQDADVWGMTAKDLVQEVLPSASDQGFIPSFGRTDRDAAYFLREAGIPGHRYLDAASRSDGEGTYNYVVYDDNAVQITGFEESEPAFLPTPAADIAKVMPDLRAELDRLDLKRVDLFHDDYGGVASQGFDPGTQGLFFEGPQGQFNIIIAAAVNPWNTLYHEALHAMRAMNLFTPAEWRALEVKAARFWVQKYDIPERYPDLLPSQQIEEAIAEAFADHYTRQEPPTGSTLIRAFNKIIRLLKAIRNVLRGAGFQTAEDVFGRAYAGALAQRAQTKGGAGFGQPRPPFAQAARLPGRQTRAHMATAMMGQQAYIPDRRIWEELRNASAPAWDRLRNARGAVTDWIDKGRILFQDKFLPVLRAQQAVMERFGVTLSDDQNAYLKEETFSGKVGRHLFEIDEEYTKPIIRMIAATKGALTVEDVGDWLTARHAVERNAYIASINPKMPDGGSGMMNADAQAILAQAAAGPHAQTLKDIGQMIDRLRERTLQLRVDAGLMDPADAALWRAQYKFYVPLKGYADTDHSEAFLDLNGLGKRNVVRGPESQRALGRSSEAFNPLQAAITQAQEVAVRAEKNRIFAALYELASTYPSPALWTVKAVKMKRYFNRTTGLVETRPENPVTMMLDPNETAGKIAGKEHRITFNDPRLAKAAGSVGADRMGFFIAFMSKVGRLFSSVNTMLDPEFVIRNAFRDMTAAQLSIREFGEADRNAIAVAMLKNWPKAFAGVYGGQKGKAATAWQQRYAEFEKSGAKVSFWVLDQPEAAKSDLEKRIRMAGGSTFGPASRFVRFSTRDNPVLGFIERTNLAVDNAVRLAAYSAARDKGWSEQQAASLAKNLTVNFNRRGEWGATLNALYPFFNASVQGSRTVLRAITSKRMAKYTVGLVALGAILDMVNASLSARDDDDELAYDKIPDYKNRVNMVVMLGPDAGNAATVWMPYGYALFPYAGQQAAKVWRGVKTPDEALSDVAAAFMMNFSPIQGESGQSFITPTVLDPINEMTLNRDWLGRPIRPENAYADYGPDAYKFFAGASEASKAAADVLNRATGGDEATSGLIDISPEYIDHMFGFVTGGAGRFWSRTADLAAKAAGGDFEAIESRNVPVVRALGYETGDWLDRDRYYTFRDKVREAAAAAKVYQGQGRRVPPEVAREANLIGALNAAEKALRAARKAGAQPPGDPYLRFNRLYVRAMGPQGE